MTTFKQFLEGLKDLAKDADENPPIVPVVMLDVLKSQAEKSKYKMQITNADPKKAELHFEYRDENHITLMTSVFFYPDRTSMQWGRWGGGHSGNQTFDHSEYGTPTELARVILHRLHYVADLLYGQ